MKFTGPEEVGGVAISRTSGPSLVCVFAAHASPSDVASPSKVGGQGAEGGGFSGT
jgi:hypothetical protein